MMFRKTIKNVSKNCILLCISYKVLYMYKALQLTHSLKTDLYTIVNDAYAERAFFRALIKADFLEAPVLGCKIPFCTALSILL